MASLRENGTISVSYHVNDDDCMFVKYFPNLRTAYDWIVSQVGQARQKEQRIYDGLQFWEMNCSSYEDLIKKFASSETCFYDHSKIVNGKPTEIQTIIVAEDGTDSQKMLIISGIYNLNYEDALKKEYYSKYGRNGICYDILCDIPDKPSTLYVYNDPINKT